MKRTTKRIVPLWLLVIIGAAVASGTVLYTYWTITFRATVVENVGVWAVMDNRDFQIPDNGAANIRYTVYNYSGTSKTLTLISNVPQVTGDRLWYASYYPWPTSNNRVWVDGVNYGFTIANNTTLELKVTVGDAGPATPGQSWSNLQLYLMDNVLY